MADQGPSESSPPVRDWLLAQAVIEGTRAEASLQQPDTLPAQEHARLRDVAAAGEAARVVLFDGLDEAITRMAQRQRSLTATLTQLTDAGHAGLNQALIRFSGPDVPRVPFRSYAVWWIRNAIVERAR